MLSPTELLVLAVALYLPSCFLYYRFFHTLSKYPGPFWASFTSLWLVHQVLIGRRLETEEVNLHKKHGKQTFQIM